MSCGVFILALNAILNTQHIPQTTFSKSYFRRDRRLRSIDRWRRNTTFCLWIAIVTETPRARRVSRFAGSISHSLKLSCIFMTKREAEGVCDVCSICCTSPPRSLDSNEQQFIFVHHLHETLVHAPICFQRFYLYTTHTFCVCGSGIICARGQHHILYYFVVFSCWHLQFVYIQV